MEFDDIPASRKLVEIVDVLGDERELGEVVLEAGETVVGRVRSRGSRLKAVIVATSSMATSSQMPPFPRKVGMPLSALIPAPVRALTDRAVKKASMKESKSYRVPSRNGDSIMLTPVS
jgi:hypothetical protein